MASAIARAYNGGLGAEPPVVQGQSPWSGQGAKHPDAENVLIFEAPEVTFKRIKMFFYCNCSTKKHLQIAIKHL